MKRNFLAAAIGALMIGEAFGTGATNGGNRGFARRSYKIRPENYTHPMLVSSRTEIAAWNREVVKKKLAKLIDRNKRHANFGDRYADFALKTN